MGRGFTLLEIMIVMGVILILTSLVLGVGSALLKRAERSQVESAMSIVESAFSEWEAQTGRPLTYNGAFNSLTNPTTEVFPSGTASSALLFDVVEPPATPAPTAPNNAGNRLIFTRARGAGIYAVNLLSQIETIRSMLASIPPSLLRPESSLSNYPASNLSLGTPGVLYTPSAKATVGSGSTRAELIDTWGGRVAFVFPGRAFRFGVDSGVPDSDGTVRTPAENILGVCTNRRICLVSAGPDGLFGVSGEVTPDTPVARAAAAADNIYLYELDPPD
ncbi:MAG: prepilin-type N-terminal cleavage/methylation domain-containing protein [Proteobacteria bacterium]|nr:prepilin-type N-terminal cleavage/methylation domain-containing protein [Pseudomonadota bacterium]